MLPGLCTRRTARCRGVKFVRGDVPGCQLPTGRKPEATDTHARTYAHTHTHTHTHMIVCKRIHKHTLREGMITELCSFQSLTFSLPVSFCLSLPQSVAFCPSLNIVNYIQAHNSRTASFSGNTYACLCVGVCVCMVYSVLYWSGLVSFYRFIWRPPFVTFSV